MPRVHIVIPTHTTRHLRACVGAIPHQSDPPETVVVTSDADDPEIERELRAVRSSVWALAEARGQRIPKLLYTARPHQGTPLLNQVRNNGLRVLAARGARTGDLVIVLDGDTVLDPDAVKRHRTMSENGAELIVPYRVNLSQPATEALDLDDLLDPARGPEIIRALATAEDKELLRRRQRRYERQLLLKRLAPPWTGLVKRHKPKIIGGHHAVTFGRLRAVNGYDEAYEEYGCNDDDLGLRLHMLTPRIRTRIAVDPIRAFHLWHPTRALRPPTESPGYARFTRPGIPARAELGLDSPREQPAPRTVELTPVRASAAV